LTLGNISVIIKSNNLSDRGATSISNFILDARS